VEKRISTPFITSFRPLGMPLCESRYQLRSFAERRCTSEARLFRIVKRLSASNNRYSEEGVDSISMASVTALRQTQRSSFESVRRYGLAGPMALGP
jgi:hypothetical protein